METKALQQQQVHLLQWVSYGDNPTRYKHMVGRTYFNYPGANNGVSKVAFKVYFMFEEMNAVWFHGTEYVDEALGLPNFVARVYLERDDACEIPPTEYQVPGCQRSHTGWTWIFEYDNRLDWFGNGGNVDTSTVTAENMEGKPRIVDLRDGVYSFNTGWGNNFNVFTYNHYWFHPPIECDCEPDYLENDYRDQPKCHYHQWGSSAIEEPHENVIDVYKKLSDGSFAEASPGDTEWYICMGEVSGTPCAMCCPPPVRLDPFSEQDGQAVEPLAKMANPRMTCNVYGLDTCPCTPQEARRLELVSAVVDGLSAWNSASPVPLFVESISHSSTPQFVGDDTVYFTTVTLDQALRKRHYGVGGWTETIEFLGDNFVDCSGHVVSKPTKKINSATIFIVDTLQPPQLNTGVRLKSTVLHEMGHVIFGLGHAQFANDRYNARYDSPCYPNKKSVMCKGGEDSLVPSDLDKDALKCLFNGDIHF